MLLNIQYYFFTDYRDGLVSNLSGHFDFSLRDSDVDNCLDYEWNLRTVFDSPVTNSVFGDAYGILNYTLSFVPPPRANCQIFKSVVLDVASLGTGTRVTKSIAGLTFPYLISNDGNIASALLGGTSVNVTDEFMVTNTGELNSFINSYTQANAIPAPGPLPLFGMGVAFGFSRRLRNRIKGFWLA